MVIFNIPLPVQTFGILEVHLCFILTVPQVLSILSSFVSMAWCIASYHRCIRWSQVDKVNISWWGTIMQTMWHFLVSGKSGSLNNIQLFCINMHTYICIRILHKYAYIQIWQPEALSYQISNKSSLNTNIC